MHPVSFAGPTAGPHDRYGRTIAPIHLSAPDLLTMLGVASARAGLAEQLGGPLVIELGAPVSIGTHHIDALQSLPTVLVGLGNAGPATPGAALVDIVVQIDALDRVLDVLATWPLASTAVAMLLRGGASRSVADGLLAESATYSLLQGGPEFASWRAAHPVRVRRDTSAQPPVRWARQGASLEIILARPEVHNALNRSMRDGLVAALLLAADDDSVTAIALRGEGATFCSGGDLDEFGSRPDPATAHLVRLARSPAALVHHLSARVTAHVHGACRGSGVELPAFASRVVASPTATFGLPEIGMGLIPGAGGTVSLPRRIGRHRTALLALTMEPVDAPTALRWGLVDAIEP